MTTQRAPDPVHTSAPASPGVLFARTREDLLVARIGDYAFAMLPGHGGSYYFASAWLLHKPIEEWTHTDFFSRSGEVADEAAFCARVEESAEHQKQRATLRRRAIHSTANTPWGPSQGATVYTDGVVCHSTAGHGGFHLDATHNA